jgi:hypothetical protein
MRLATQAEGQCDLTDSSWVSISFQSRGSRFGSQMALAEVKIFLRHVHGFDLLARFVAFNF